MTSQDNAASSTAMVRRTEASPKYDMRVNPVYQIDFLNAASGKRLGVTKRRVRFRFGFSNAEALAQGLTGVDCRGEEHEVTLVWSLTSGKRTVMADGHEVHFSKIKAVTDGRFETTWTMAGHHVVKLVAHAAPPLFSNVQGFRQYDLQLDGFSFFEMPRIFELGVKNDVVAPMPRHLLPTVENYQRQYAEDDRGVTSYPNRRSLQEEYSEYTPSYDSAPSSHHDRRHSVPSLPSSHSEDRSFTSSAQQQAPLSTSAGTPTTMDLISEMSPSVSDFLDANSSTPPLHSSPKDEFAPKQLTAPTPETAFASVTNQILQAYGPMATTNGVLALAYESHTHGVPHHQSEPQALTPPPYHQQPQYGNSAYSQQTRQFQYQHQQPHYPASSSLDFTHHQAISQAPYSGSPVSVMSPPERPQLVPIIPSMIKPLNLVEEEDRAQPHFTELERAMKNLVNLEDITEPLETPEQIKARQRHVEQQPLKSKPLPPKEPEWHLGLKPLLADIQKHKKPVAAPTKEVMRTHAFDPAVAQAGMLVVYGQPMSPQGLSTPSGFGAGFHTGYYGGSVGYYHQGVSYASAPPVSNATARSVAPQAFAAY